MVAELWKTVLLFVGRHGICWFRYRVESFQIWCSNAGRIAHNLFDSFVIIAAVGPLEVCEGGHNSTSDSVIPLTASSMVEELLQCWVVCTCNQAELGRATPNSHNYTLYFISLIHTPFYLMLYKNRPNKEFGAHRVNKDCTYYDVAHFRCYSIYIYIYIHSYK